MRPCKRQRNSKARDAVHYHRAKQGERVFNRAYHAVIVVACYNQMLPAVEDSFPLLPVVCEILEFLWLRPVIE
jgi:hypothetical protein